MEDDALWVHCESSPHRCLESETERSVVPQLTRASDNSEIARCVRQRLKEGVISDKKPRITLHLHQPKELTLDLSLLLTTFLWMDHPRLQKQLSMVGDQGLRPPERPRCSSETERSL